MRELRLGAEQQAALFPRLPVHVQRAAVAAVDLQLPTWRRPLVVRVRGVRLDLLQRNMPVVGSRPRRPVAPGRRPVWQSSARGRPQAVSSRRRGREGPGAGGGAWL